MQTFPRSWAIPERNDFTADPSFGLVIGRPALAQPWRDAFSRVARAEVVISPAAEMIATFAGAGVC